MNINIAIVAHKKRRDAAHKLAEVVQADHISMDDGTRGVNANHRAAWVWHLTHPADWAVTIEDDAVPCKDFRYQLAQALTAAPAHLVNLYLGKVCPEHWQSKLDNATRRAEQHKACFIVGNHNLHAVGLACDRSNVRFLLQGMTTYGVYAVDDAISNWTVNNNIDIAYTWPSLVNHADGPSLATPLHGQTRPAGSGRVAWKHGSRRKWSTSSVPLIVSEAGT